MKLRSLLAFLVMLGLGPSVSFARTATPAESPVKPTVGFELNFTNAEIISVWRKQGDLEEVNNSANESYRDQLAALVRTSCENCQIAEFKNSYNVKAYRVTYPDGWFFQVNTDPAMIEIQTAPVTVDQLHDNVAQRIERDIFGNTKKLGLIVPQEAGFWNLAGGHIHFGITSSLGGSLLLFRNLFVDYANHSELASGVFVHDVQNAPSIPFLEDSQRAALAQIVADVDSGKIRSINTFARRIRDEVYYKTPKGSEPASKYQAFNLNRIGNLKQSLFQLAQQTFELRAFPAQDSAIKMFLEANLIQARILWLQKNGGRVALSIPTSQQTPQEKVDAFYRYVSESGLDFAPYVQFLPPAFRDWVGTAAGNYRQSKALSCEAIFN